MLTFRGHEYPGIRILSWMGKEKLLCQGVFNLLALLRVLTQGSWLLLNLGNDSVLKIKTRCSAVKGHFDMEEKFLLQDKERCFSLYVFM